MYTPTRCERNRIATMIGLGLPLALGLIVAGLCILGWGFLASDRRLSGPMRVTCIGLGMILIGAGVTFIGR